MLSILDSMELGLDNEDGTTTSQSLQHGIRLTLESFQSVLADFGVQAIDPQEQPFDPQYHEAINIEPVSNLPANMVCRVYQKGYLLNGRVIRPARVIVSMPQQDIEH